MKWAMLSGLLMTGCVAHLPTMVSTTSLGENEKPICMATGKASSVSLWFLGPFDDDSLRAAIKDAIGPTDADTMVNVFVDRSIFCIPFCQFPLLLMRTTQVYGTLIKYTDSSFAHTELISGHPVDPDSNPPIWDK